MILAVTGITGHTGRFFLKELEDNHFEGIVRCLVRTQSYTKQMDSSSLKVEKVIGDINNYKDLIVLTEKADVVMHIYNIYNSVDILNACIENHVPRLVMVHTTGVYSKYKMASGKYKEAEAKIERILQSSTIDVTILRPTMIFGDMCDRNVSKFIRMVDKYPVMLEIDHGSGRIQPVNARDLAVAYYRVCTMRNLPELYYDLSGEKSIRIYDLYEFIGRYLGKKVYHFSCPIWLGVNITKIMKICSFGRIDYVERVLRMGENRDYGHGPATRDFAYQPESFDISIRREVSEYLHEKEKKRWHRNQ